ncbi:hypothetical protein ACFFJT_16515 [Dyella flava]|uniref:Peptidase M23 n=1 Tax=Dyella flava TaxID=1920170 RepID=A0ABS2K3P7_9GAMM|nr:M23 family metallopeptidase [Dyella flava]MBM7125868.1 peptidase M23 [Dyella flava]GLQ48614.1 kinase [Dyella flava]
MIISPPFLPQPDPTFRNADAIDPVMDAVEGFELAHGIYPIAFDRRWHGGVHLAPNMDMEVRAIADGEVVAYRVCQHVYDRGEGTPDSNAGFVLLKHTTETGDGRTLTFYSLYMHLLELAGYQSIGADAQLIPAFLRRPVGHPYRKVIPAAQPGGGQKVYRKDILGWIGQCHGQKHLHFEIFMTQEDFNAYFGTTQLGNTHPRTPSSTDYWGHSYYVIPGGQTLRSTAPSQFDSHYFPTLQQGQLDDDHTLYVEAYFDKGHRYTQSWIDKGDGHRMPLTDKPVKEEDYEYQLYERATKLYPGCPSDGYELLRFGRILSSPATLTDGQVTTGLGFASGMAGDSRPMHIESPCATWVSVMFDQGKRGYIDIHHPSIQKLSDADFPCFKGWQKLSEGNGPFNGDGLCDIDSLKKLVKDVADHQTAQEIAQKQEYKKEDILARYIKFNDKVRQQLHGFVCQAPSEWDSSSNHARYQKLMAEGEFYHGDEPGYDAFIKLLSSFQFWDKTGFKPGEKFWFFHPLAFIRHFRKCGWLSTDEIASTFPKYAYYKLAQNTYSAITNSVNATITKQIATERVGKYKTALNIAMRKYGIANNRNRQVQFLGQVFLETDRWNTIKEYGEGRYNPTQPATEYYAAFYGRGVLQLTWADLYDAYGAFMHLANNASEIYADPRISKTSAHWFGDPRQKDAQGKVVIAGRKQTWCPRYDPQTICESLDLTCDSGGFFWIYKHHDGVRNINRVADLPVNQASIARVSILVNGGGNGFYERQAFSLFVAKRLTDMTNVDQMCTFTPPKCSKSITINYSNIEE